MSVVCPLPAPRVLCLLLACLAASGCRDPQANAGTPAADPAPGSDAHGDRPPPATAAGVSAEADSGGADSTEADAEPAPRPKPPLLSAAEVAEDVRQLLVALDDNPDIDIVSARRGAATFEISYRSRKEALPRTVHVSFDGRYIASTLLDVRQRTMILRADRTFADCMEQQGVRVYVALPEEHSRQQVAELGAYGERVVVDCSGEQRALCEANGVRSFPTLVWKEGSEIGLQRRTDIGLATGCK